VFVGSKRGGQTSRPWGFEPLVYPFGISTLFRGNPLPSRFQADSGKCWIRTNPPSLYGKGVPCL